MSGTETFKLDGLPGGRFVIPRLIELEVTGPTESDRQLVAFSFAPKFVEISSTRDGRTRVPTTAFKALLQVVEQLKEKGVLIL